MQFRWPFPNRTHNRPADDAALHDAALCQARTELNLAETALDQARITYLRLQDARQTAKLRLQQAVLDEALLRYHAARQSVRILEQQDIAATPWLGSIRRRGLVGAALTKG
jgi:hypothetical protein